RGQYEPGSTSGQGLLAHELAHVVQQHAGRRPPGGIDTPGDPHEREAEAAARAVTSGKTATITGATPPPTVQRAAKPGPGGSSSAPQPTAMRGDVHILPKDPEFALKIPKQKVSSQGSDREQVKNRYEKAAAAGALRTTHAGRGQSSTLWNAWEKSRKFQLPDDVKKQKKGKCQVDHVIELQVGGADAPDNLRLLESGRNMSAGSMLNQQIQTLRASAQAKWKLAPNAVLQFGQVEIEEADPSPDNDCLD